VDCKFVLTGNRKMVYYTQGRRITKLRIEIVEECEHDYEGQHETSACWAQESPHETRPDCYCRGNRRRVATESELLTLVADLLKGRGLLLVPDENGWPPEVRAASRSAIQRVGLLGFVDAFLLDLIELQACVLVDGPKEER